MSALTFLLVTITFVNLYIDSTEDCLDSDITTSTTETEQEYTASTDLEVWAYRR